MSSNFGKQYTLATDWSCLGCNDKQQEERKSRNHIVQMYILQSIFTVIESKTQVMRRDLFLTFPVAL